MKILVLSDSHGKEEYLYTTVYEHLDSDVIIHLGDGERDMDVLRDLPAVQRKRIIQVAGNCDYASQLPTTTFETIGGYKFYITHGHMQHVKMGYDLITLDAKKQKRQVVLFGHTHQPYFSEENGIYLFNPGSLYRGEYGIISVVDTELTFHHQSL